MYNSRNALTLKNFHFRTKLSCEAFSKSEQVLLIFARTRVRGETRRNIEFLSLPVFPQFFLSLSLPPVFIFLLFFFLTRHLPRCQIGVLAGLLSTSHFRLTDIPSTIGIPKPGKRVIANDGVSETGIKQLVSVSMSMRVGRVCKVSRKHQKETRISIEYFRVASAD